MHPIKTILGLVGASLVVKAIEKCSDKQTVRTRRCNKLYTKWSRKFMEIFYTLKIIMAWRRLEH